MTKQFMAFRLWQLGYLWDVPQSQLDTLEDSHRIVKAALWEFQRAHGVEFQRRGWPEHGRAAVADGDSGPVTESLLEPAARFCPLPDNPPPMGTTFLFDDPDLQSAVVSQQHAAARATRGSGSWPHGCWPEFPGIHRVLQAVDVRHQPEHDKHGDWDYTMRVNRQSCAQMGLRVDYVLWDSRRDDRPRADVYVEWVLRSPGWIGLAQFPSAKCTDEVFHKLLATYNGGREKKATLHSHEGGHNWGLQHLNGSNSIMNPVINDAGPWWNGDASEARMKSRFWRGQPIDLDDKPPKEPDPPAPEPPEDIEAIVRKLQSWIASNPDQFTGPPGPQGERGPAGQRGEQGPKGATNGIDKDYLRQVGRWLLQQPNTWPAGASALRKINELAQLWSKL